MPLSSYIDRVKKLIPQAEAELPPTALDSSMESAVEEYSRLRPRILVQEYTGDGTTYDFSLPTDFTLGFSRIISIEYPAGERSPVYLKPQYYFIYRKPTATVLRLLITPQSTKKFNVAYTALHKVDATTDTIPSSDFEAVCFLAAHYIAQALAAKYAGYWEPTLAADIVAYRTKNREYQEVATNFLTLFKLHLGMKPKDVTLPALSFIDIAPKREIGGAREL